MLQLSHFSRARHFWWLWILVGVLALHLAPMLFGRTLIFGDNYSLLVPGKLFTAYWLRHGQLPLWNPYIFAGISWIGDVTQSVIYPSTLVFAALPAAVALNLTVAAHVLLSAGGMYGLARAWGRSQGAAVLASILWMLSTQLTGSINNLATIQSLSWLPWIIWAGQGVALRPRAKYALAVVVALQFLAGYPQHVVYGVAMAGLCSIFLSWRKTSWRHWVWSWVQAGLWSLALSAVAWLPFVPTLLSSTRLSQSVDQAAVGSLSPAMLAKAALPYIFDKPSAGMKWGPTWSGQPNMVFYMSWLGWLALGIWSARLAAKGWAVRAKRSARLTWLRQHAEDLWWAGIVAATLLLALGENVPGYNLLQQAVPFFRVGRYPSMVLILTTIALALWVARAAEQLVAASQTLRLKWWLIGAASLAAVAAVALLLIHHHFAWLWNLTDTTLGGRISASAFHTLERDQVIARVVFSDLFVTATLAAIGLWLVQTRYKRRWLLVGAVITADLLFHTAGQFIWAPAAVYPSWREIEQNHGQVLGEPVNPHVRYLTRNGNQPYTDFGSYWEALVVRAPFSDSFVDAEQLRTFSHPQRLRDGYTPNWQMVYGVPVVNGYTSLLPLDYAEVWSSGAAAADAEARINFIPYISLQNPELAEWGVGFYLVDTWFDQTAADNFTRLSASTNLDVWQLYALAQTSRFYWSDLTIADISNLQQTPNTLEFTVANPAGGPRDLVIADRYEAGWQVTLDGAAAQLTNNQGKRQLQVPPGEHRVRLTYSPRTWELGLALSVVSSLWVILLISRRTH